MRGVRTYAFLGPLLPYLSDIEGSLVPLLKALKDVGVDYFYVDRLNPRFGVWASVKDLLQEHFPHLVGEYRKILFDERIRREYSHQIVSTVNRLAKNQGLDGKMSDCCYSRAINRADI